MVPKKAHPVQAKSKNWTYNALPSNATERKNMKSIRFEMVLVPINEYLSKSYCRET